MSGLVIIQDPNGKAQVKDEYDSIEFTLNTGETNYDLDTNQANFKSNVEHPYYVEIFSTEEISIKFNSTSNHSITIQADTLRVFDRQEAMNIYLTNASGTNSNVKIYVK